ncbi:cytochrome P450 76A2-like [Nicotiana tabacum]|uniref:Cytochrome P450 76A2-like n=1 Tax=Nicotiana tabacum TaxID=4097 RepID=A0A1S3YEC5_TOBAC|nr:PREDICTED: cytochrome P450 76A2-like [Nicotiana tabacum]
MEWEWSYVVWSVIILVPTLIIVFSRKRSSSYNLPPGPPGLPIFGNMFDLGTLPYQTIASFKHKYGPIVWFNIGSVKTMSILSAKTAADFFKNHDFAFAERKIIDTMLVHDYNKGSLALAPYGTYWRVLRRICTVEMFVNKRINETVDIRRKCVHDMLQWIEDEANVVEIKGSGTEVTRFVFLSTFNMLGNLMFSRDLVHPGSKKASEFFTAMMRIMEWSGNPNVSDIFPCLRRFDLQGLNKKMQRDMGNALEIASTFVKERMKEREDGGEKKKDFLDVLLDFEGSGKDEPAKLTEHQINIFILEMFLAGSETTSSSIEWTLTELLRHPEAMAKVKAEISEVVGKNKKLEESDIDNLPYMQAVIKEALRLHPPLPFLVPRRAIHDTKFMGYDIPEDTQVFVNVWSIGRDSEYWDDPLNFKPERFLNSKIDFKGQCFEFLPFGAGRRMCVGLPLGNRMLHVVLGSLLHEFDWELPENVTPKSMDMKERMGMTVRKFQPLKAVPRKTSG